MKSKITTLFGAAALTCALLVPAQAEASFGPPARKMVVKKVTYPIVPVGKIKVSGFKKFGPMKKGAVSVPELGGQNTAAAFALLGGAALLLSQRRRRQVA